MSARNAFIAAYAAQHNCPPRSADRLLRAVELAYAETENARLRQQIDDMAGAQMQAESAERKRLQAIIETLSEPVMGIREVAEWLGISCQSVAKHVTGRRLVPFQVLACGPVFRTSDVEEFARRRRPAGRPKKNPS